MIEEVLVIPEEFAAFGYFAIAVDFVKLEEIEKLMEVLMAVEFVIMEELVTAVKFVVMEKLVIVVMTAAAVTFVIAVIFEREFVIE